MKTFILLIVVSLSSHAISTAKKEAPKKQIKKAQASKPVHPLLKEEDCDDKAKKPIEIKPETISLSGNTGCTLPE